MKTQDELQERHIDLILEVGMNTRAILEYKAEIDQLEKVNIGHIKELEEIELQVDMYEAKEQGTLS